MKRTMIIVALSLLLTAPGFAQMGGGGMGGGGDHGDGSGGMGGGDMGGGGMGSGSMTGGAALVVVADDSSVLLTKGHGFMGWQDDDDDIAELVNIGADGSERWRVAFDGGQPMMTVTTGDLVVVNLMEVGGWEDEGDDWHSGGMGQGSVSLVCLDLVSGVELWTFTLEEPSMLRAQISEDGSLIYVVATDASEMGSGSMGQGDSGFGGQMKSTLYVLDRSGNLLWSLNLGDD